VRRAPVFFLVLLSFSCSLFRKKVDPYPTGAVFPLEEVGRVAIEGKLNRTLVKGEDGRLYFSTDKGHLYCLDGAAQQLSWHQTNPVPFAGPPSLSPDRLFVWDEDNTVLCFDRQGKPGWKTKVPDRISGSISLDRERIYVGTEAGDLIALNLATGEPVWRFRTKGAIAAAAVFYRDSIIAGSSDGLVYWLDPKGIRRSRIDLGSPVLVTPLVDGDLLFVGTEDFAFHCYDLRSLKRKWKIKAGGKILVTPSADERRVYLQTSNSVIYALDKSGGEILWWWIAPSRSSYKLEFDGSRVLVTSRSPLLFSLERRSGKVVGKYQARTEIKSNAVWAEPNLLLATFDSPADRGIITFLRKEVKVGIAPSLSSPRPAGTEISFTASATGFYLPRYEFFLRQGEEKSVVQKAAEKNSWVWFAEKEGTFAIGVKVTDERQAQEAEIPFEISKIEKQTEGHDPPKKEKKDETRRGA
jgi:outer membrane protein assembly factor BamB